MVVVKKGLLETIKAGLGSYRTAERKVAEMLLSAPDEALRLNVKTLSAKADVSEPTIIRFVRKLGCDGFPQFRIQLAQELAMDRVFAEIGQAEPSVSGHLLNDRVAQSATRAIARAVEALDDATIGAVAGLLASCSRLYCYGVGGSSAIVAREAENRFFRAGIASQMSEDPYRQVMDAALAGPADVFVMFSATGRPASLLDAAEIARSRGAKVVSVTHGHSPLAERSDYVFRVNGPAPETPRYYFPSPVRYEQLLIVDCIAARVTVDLGDAAIQKLRSIRAALAALHGPMPEQPAGD
ncbi:MAG: MurR/RpiR family transcriptional regulator [Devosia sp.]|nr:MurR/RpiR family transcriptional regulator [Devosia sp.]